MKFGQCTEGIDGVSIPLRGLCQVCNPDSGQCEDCSDDTCTYCDP